MSGFDPDWVVAPGETLADWFDEKGYRTGSQRARYVAAFGIPRPQLNRIVLGAEPIDEELARKLGNMTLIPGSFWLALERNYRVGLAAGKTCV